MAPYHAYDLATFKATAKLADKVIVSTKFEHEDAVEFGINKNKIIVIPMGVDIDVYENKASHKVRDFIELLFVGRIARNRNIETLLHSLSRLDKNFKLKIVGKETRTSSATRYGYMNDLNRLIDKLGLKGRVEFTGQKVGADLLECYKNADIFVCASIYESFGQPILEAAAAGLPIVSTPVGVARELIIDNQTGFLTTYCKGEKEDSLSEEFAEKISSLNDQKTRKEFGKKIQNITKLNFSWDAIIEQYCNLYNGLSR